MDFPTEFRILCPAGRTGVVLGKGGSVFRRLESLTGAKIHVLDTDTLSSSDERIILIHAAAATDANTNSNTDHLRDANGNNDNKNNNHLDAENVNLSSAQQRALVGVFERIVKGDDGEEEEEQEEKEKEKEVNSAGVVSETESPSTSTVCRLLVKSDQLAWLIGRGGVRGFVEKIEQESGAQVRVLAKDQIPACASSSDELIQITGNFSAVKKVLLFVSTCLQDSPGSDAANSAATNSSGAVFQGNAVPAQVDPFPQRGYTPGRHAPDYHPRGYPSISGAENIDTHNRMIIEEEVIFKLLCQSDKVGSLIGKGGSVVRALQNDTGASIKVIDAVPDADERVVVIAARENSEQNHSPAQDAVIRVQNRIAEIGFEPGAAVLARLLVPSQQVGCLLGKGGSIVTEMRRATGASIRVFQREQVPRCASQNDEVVQDALFHITGRLRETIFPIRPPLPGFNAPPPYLPPFPEMAPYQFWPRHNPASPGSYPSPVGPFHHDRSAVPSQPHDHLPSFSHGMDHIGPPNVDRGSYHYGSNRPGHGPSYESSPRSWNPQAVSSGHLRGVADVGHGMASRSRPPGSQVPISTSTPVEVVIPQNFLAHVNGENNSNLNQIRQISGANVVVHDPKPGAAEGVVVISGTPEQMRTAQILIQAFILCGHTAP